MHDPNRNTEMPSWVSFLTFLCEVRQSINKYIHWFIFKSIGWYIQKVICLLKISWQYRGKNSWNIVSAKVFIAKTFGGKWKYLCKQINGEQFWNSSKPSKNCIYFTVLLCQLPFYYTINDSIFTYVASIIITVMHCITIFGSMIDCIYDSGQSNRLCYMA